MQPKSNNERVFPTAREDAQAYSTAFWIPFGNEDRGEAVTRPRKL